MSIKRENKEYGRFTLEFDDYDSRAFDRVREVWGFVDDESLVRFAMAILIQAEGKTLGVLESKYLFQKWSKLMPIPSSIKKT